MKQIQLNAKNQEVIVESVRILISNIDIEEKINENIIISLAEIGRLLRNKINNGELLHIPAITSNFKLSLNYGESTVSLYINFEPDKVELISTIHFIWRCLIPVMQNPVGFNDFLDNFRVI